MKRCFCSSGSQQNPENNSTSTTYRTHYSSDNRQAQPSNQQGPSQHSQQTNPTLSAGSTPGASSPPRTSSAADVIDKHLGPSTLKLEKRDDRSPPPPPPPPRRNYGSQGSQEKKSGKDLVAESAACAVIEKYLGPWPGFPPRDPKIDEYLDSLPENAACAAIDKYFGPYKPLFVFKKNEQNANSPPPPSRPPRNRMTSRTRNRWNASQQGVSDQRPWTAPQQHATSNPGPVQSNRLSPNAPASPSQGASAYASPPQGAPFRAEADAVPPQQQAHGSAVAQSDESLPQGVNSNLPKGT
ncbi:hypothetical protein KP509_13G045700 [Ceratopteris richardii]|nr:hypothetical protein KP509_13G045700 [Ceratopteris richardii]